MRQEVREALILEGLRHIKYVVAPLSNAVRYVSSLDVDDVISEAILAVVEHVDNYDIEHESGASFGTFIEHRIRGAIIDYLIRMSPLTLRRVEEDIETYANNGGAKKLSTNPELDYINRLSLPELSFDNVSPVHKIYLELFFNRDLSVREIGKLLGVSAANATKMVQRALLSVKIVKHGDTSCL